MEEVELRLDEKRELEIGRWPRVGEEPHLRSAIVAAFKAGDMLRVGFSEVFPTWVNPDRSEYTPYDAEAERIASQVIKGLDSSALIQGEDIRPDQDVSRGKFWTIDGLDGTTNFARRLPFCCHTLAYVEGGETSVGVVNDFLYKDPNEDFYGNLYYAIEGKGAYLNGRRITVAKRPFNQSVITFAPLLDVRKGKGETEGLEVAALWAGMKEISEESGRFGREFQCGGLELAWVASGRLDGYASSWTNPWDLSAGALLVKEAGGIATNIFGEPWRPGFYGVIAGSRTVQPEMLRIFQKHRMSFQGRAVLT